MERKHPLGVTIVPVLRIVNGIILGVGEIWAECFIPSLTTPKLTL